MEKRQDTRLRINGLNAALVEGHEGTSLVSTLDYIEAMRESHPISDEGKTTRQRLNDYLESSIRPMKDYQTRGKQ